MQTWGRAWHAGAELAPDAGARGSAALGAADEEPSLSPSVVSPLPARMPAVKVTHRGLPVPAVLRVPTRHTASGSVGSRGAAAILWPCAAGTAPPTVGSQGSRGRRG